MKETIGRRGFFGRIFGGAAAIVAAPHLSTSQPRLIPGSLRSVQMKRFAAVLARPLEPSIFTTHNLEQVYIPGVIEVDELVEKIPDLEIDVSGWFGCNKTKEWPPPGCPLGYY